MFARWHDLTHEHFAAIDFEHAVAVMPVAATEQHGPHLPVSVDADINAGILAAAGEALDPAIAVYALPMLPIGKSNEHQAFPGTLTIGAETLIRLWTDVAESVLRAGFRRIVILNSHGGQPQLVDVVVRDLRVRYCVLAVAANTYALGLPEGLFDADEERHGIHAGAIETSMMMHLRPETIRHERIADFPSAGRDVERENDVLRLEGGIGMGWMSQDVNPSGAIGDARGADPQRGATAIRFAGERLAALLAEVSRYPLDRLKARG